MNLTLCFEPREQNVVLDMDVLLEVVGELLHPGIKCLPRPASAGRRRERIGEFL